MATRSTSHDAWMDAFFTSYYRHRPVNATFIGEHAYDAALPDLSDSAVGDTLAAGRGLMASPASGVEPAQTLDRRLAEGFLKIQEWELTGTHFHRGNPSFYTGEAAFGILGLFLTDYAPVTERVEAAVARMEALPAFLAQARENVREAPAAWTERALRECDGVLALLTQGMEVLLADLGVTDGMVHESAGRAARAVAEHRTHLRTGLLERDNGAYAAGEEALALHVTQGHFLDQAADEILAYATDQLREARSYLQAHAADFGASSPAEALAGLADIHPDAENYHGRYQEIWDEVQQVSEARRLVTWPDFPVRYVPRPRWTREAAPHLYFLFYRSPAAVNRPAVHDYLVAPLDESAPTEEVERFLKANNDSVIKLNHVVHHGGLGHHVQNWHAFRAESRIGRMAAVDCASRIAMLCGGTMAEGWACYATDLAAEAGALTPLEQYGEVHARVRMAARAVVDVELHRGRKSLREAALFYEEQASMSPAAAWGEAVKNSMFPGGALMYLMGTDAIHDLRETLMRRDGPDFDLRGFHDAFLSYGSVPVSLIAQAMTSEGAGTAKAPTAETDPGAHHAE